MDLFPSYSMPNSTVTRGSAQNLGLAFDHNTNCGDTIVSAQWDLDLDGQYSLLGRRRS